MLIIALSALVSIWRTVNRMAIATKALSISLLCTASLSASLSSTQPSTDKPDPANTTPLGYTIIKEAAHARAFTQGLLVNDGTLYESSGLYQRSFIRAYDLEANRVRAKTQLPKTIFAEGLTKFGDTLFLLSWKAGTLFKYNPVSLAPEGKLRYDGEGWGLTHDGQYLIMSNGSENLLWRKPSDFSIVKQKRVHYRQRPVKNLNELEYAQDFIWANVWLTSAIIKISPDTGEVVGIADLSKLSAENSTIPQRTVLNGIAYDSANDAFWVTGKHWPKRYLIRFHEPTNDTQPKH